MSHGSYESLVCTVRLHYTGMNPFFKAAKVTQSREIPKSRDHAEIEIN